jgi:hypothetical protein
MFTPARSASFILTKNRGSTTPVLFTHITTQSRRRPGGARAPPPCRAAAPSALKARNASTYARLGDARKNAPPPPPIPMASLLWSLRPGVESPRLLLTPDLLTLPVLPKPSNATPEEASPAEPPRSAGASPPPPARPDEGRTVSAKRLMAAQQCSIISACDADDSWIGSSCSVSCRMSARSSERDASCASPSAESCSSCRFACVTGRG